MVGTGSKDLGQQFTASLKGDEILSEVETYLHGADFPETPRRPDLRMIVRNTGDTDVQFTNPGEHSAQFEIIPPGKAAMLMVAGDTLIDQEHNAEILKQRYGTGEHRLELALADLQAGRLKGLVSEVYGPVSFDDQAGRLVNADWRGADGSQITITPVRTDKEAFGVRPASEEEVFLVRGQPGETLRGTNTVAEKFNQEGLIAVAVSKGPDGRLLTRPIDIEVAKSYYGDAFNSIPVVDLDAQGQVDGVDLHPSRSVMNSVSLSPAFRMPKVIPLPVQTGMAAPAPA